MKKIRIKVSRLPLTFHGKRQTAPPKRYCMIGYEEFKGKHGRITTQKEGGGLFFQDGIFEGESTDAYFFKIEGKTVVFQKSRVIKLEFSNNQPSGQAQGGRV